jgi:hypothetical protein
MEVMRPLVDRSPLTELDLGIVTCRKVLHRRGASMKSVHRGCAESMNQGSVSSAPLR